MSIISIKNDYTDLDDPSAVSVIPPIIASMAVSSHNAAKVHSKKNWKEAAIKMYVEFIVESCDAHYYQKNS